MAKARKLAVPKEWTFRSPAVAAAFDSHVREQLPWYDLATGIVAHFARSYLRDRGRIIDVGCSTGNIGRALAKTIAARSAALVAIDSSPDMVKVYKGPGRFVCIDATAFDFQRAAPDVIICFLSLMFVPIAERPKFINLMKLSLARGGALIVFDKTEPLGGYLGTTMYRLTLAAKSEAGASPEEVIAKELSISGVQRPMRAKELEGFVEVFRFGDFAGFVYEG